jgi:hypothetical protein
VEPHDYGLLNGVRRLFVFQLERAGHLDRWDVLYARVDETD